MPSANAPRAAREEIELKNGGCVTSTTTETVEHYSRTGSLRDVPETRVELINLTMAKDDIEPPVISSAPKLFDAAKAIEAASSSLAALEMAGDLSSFDIAKFISSTRISGSSFNELVRK